MKWLKLLLLFPLFTFAQVTRVDTSVANTTTSITGTVNSEAMLVFPDPSSGITTFRVRNALQNVTLTVMNQLGQVVRKMPDLSGREFTLQHDGLLPGLHLIVVSDGKKSWTGKVVVE